MKGKKGLIGAAVLLAVLGWTIYQRQGVPILDEDTKNRLTCVLDYRNGKGKGMYLMVQAIRICKAGFLASKM